MYCFLASCREGAGRRKFREHDSGSCHWGPSQDPQSTWHILCIGGKVAMSVPYPSAEEEECLIEALALSPLAQASCLPLVLGKGEPVLGQ